MVGATDDVARDVVDDAGAVASEYVGDVCVESAEHPTAKIDIAIGATSLATQDFTREESSRPHSTTNDTSAQLARSKGLEPLTF